MQAIFRPAVETDIPMLAKARLDFLQILGHTTPDEDFFCAQKQIEGFLHAQLNRQIFAWLAFVDQNPSSVGFLQIFNVMFHPTSHTGRYGRIINVLTWPEYRNQGLARIVMEHLIAQARDLGLDYVNLHASPEGRHLYKTLGFVEDHPIDPSMTLYF